MRLHDQTYCTIYVMRAIQTQRDFLPHAEARSITCKSGVALEMHQPLRNNTSTLNTHPRGMSWKVILPLQVQCRTIVAYCLLHNLINKEMTNGKNLDNVDGEDSVYATTTVCHDIQYIETTNEWT
ncbi:retrotransposon protein [Cucumis melo var. makuwa]|uniref:Retrotransposon protein n=1 Tax=Cucumis melo var. makuwa TaxID=1194695 RepID=A0A5A7V4H6_CUCMM|nr:retrotransposon protein [Cucumis melo var. makuwa]